MAGFGFVAFMVGSLILAFLVYPALRLWPGTQKAKERRSMRALHTGYKLFFGSLRWLGGMRPMRVTGRENLPQGRPCLLIANHPCLVDIVAICLEIPDISCIVKRALWEHFFMGSIVRKAGYIPNDSAPELLESCKRVFASGRSLILFPEGTRSPPHQMHPFSRGFAQIAMRCGVDVVPIVITCDPPTLLKGQPWHYVARDYPFRLTLEILPPLHPPKEALQGKSLRVRTLRFTEHAESFFRRELGLAEVTASGAKTPGRGDGQGDANGEADDPAEAGINVGLRNEGRAGEEQVRAQ